MKGMLLKMLGIESKTVIYECRRCDKKVSATDDECPECGSEEIAVYEIE